MWVLPACVYKLSRFVCNLSWLGHAADIHLTSGFSVELMKRRKLILWKICVSLMPHLSADLLVDGFLAGYYKISSPYVVFDRHFRSLRDSIGFSL